MLTFTGEPGLTITLTGADGTLLNNGTQYTATYDATTGTYTVTLIDAVPGGAANPFGSYNGNAATGNAPAVADGSYTILATDSAANQSTVGTFVIDTRAPGVGGDGTAPTIASISSDSGIPGDFITNVRTQIFNGTAQPNQLVTVALDGVVIGTTTADAAGSWSYDYSATPISDGSHSLTASTSDLAGNTSSATRSITIDTIPASAPTVSSLATTDSTPTITGTATLSSGDTLTVTVNGISYTVGDGNLSYNNSDKSWMLIIPPQHQIIRPDTYQVVATIADRAANRISDSSSGELIITIDEHPPTTLENVNQLAIQPIVAELDYNLNNSTVSMDDRLAYSQETFTQNIEQNIDHFGELIRPVLYEMPDTAREGKNDLFARLYGVGRGREIIRPVIDESASLLDQSKNTDRELFTVSFVNLSQPAIAPPETTVSERTSEATVRDNSASSSKFTVNSAQPPPEIDTQIIAEPTIITPPREVRAKTVRPSFSAQVKAASERQRTRHALQPTRSIDAIMNDERGTKVNFDELLLAIHKPHVADNALSSNPFDKEILGFGKNQTPRSIGNRK